MSDANTNEHEVDPRFPSGPWEGYWVQRGVTGQMQLDLTFIDGRVNGGGSDPIGVFSIKGRYTIDDGVITLIKHYCHAHDVLYDGRASASGLQGRWEIGVHEDAGEWRIWPTQEEAFEIVYLEIETETGPVVIVGKIEDFSIEEAFS